MTKYIFVTGGVVSSLGKGITAASLGRILKNRGLNVVMQKLDPYLNVDPGMMSPQQHGEVFVTFDGGETDLDIGHYERFLDGKFTKQSNFTSGKIYQSILSKERAGEYGGTTIQVVPHVTNEIKNIMKSISGANVDIAIIEIGGTVGDMEGLSFLEAIRQFKMELGPSNCAHIHVTLLPYLEAAGEIKTKPTQHSVKELTSLGLSPDIIVCRSNKNVELSKENKAKLAMFCNLRGQDYVIHNPDCSSIYEVPLVLHSQHIDDVILKILNINAPKANMKEWQSMIDKFNSNYKNVNVAIVGKYSEVQDAYISITESIKHAAISQKLKAKVNIVDSFQIEKMGTKLLKGYDCIVIAGGFNSGGIEGKIKASEYARKNNIPCLGIGLGMQVMLIDIARNVLKHKNANSTEFDTTTSYPVFDMFVEQKQGVQKNGNMRLGEYPTTLQKNSEIYKLYKNNTTIYERHRHYYEFNNSYLQEFSNNGVDFVGINPDYNFVDIIQLQGKKFFVGCIFQPEFQSRPYRPHPLFVQLVKSIIK